MYMYGQLLTLASVTLLAFGQHTVDDCVFTHNKATFDLSALKTSLKSSYRVRDFDDGPERNYTYVFNVCGNAAVPEEEDRCVETESGSGPAPVFQIFNDGRCWRLGKMQTLKAHNLKWALLDQQDPTKGVSMTYLNGDKCSFVREKKNVTREFTIRFKCSDAYGRDPDARVEEDTCAYGIDFETIFGCPTECPFSNRKLCAGNGMCGMDTDLGAPRCFCNEGFDGNDCSYAGTAPVPSACSGFCVALVFVVIFMAGLLIAAGFIYYRVWKLQKLNVRFGAMTNSLIKGSAGDEEESFSLTGVNKVTKARLHH